MEELTAGCVHPFVGVRAEEVALLLEQVGGKARRAIRVVIRQRRVKGGHWYAKFGGGRNYAPPVVLAAIDLALEERIEQEIGKFGVTLISFGNLLQEAGADDAAA